MYGGDGSLPWWNHPHGASGRGGTKVLKPGSTVPGYHSITMLATSSALYLQYTDLLIAEVFQKWNRRRICYGTLASWQLPYVPILYG